MPKKSSATIDVTDEEVVAFANTLNLVLNPPNMQLEGEKIRQFGLLRLAVAQAYQARLRSTDIVDVFVVNRRNTPSR
ncbi:MAG: hypothetical protein IH987_03260 [Planctomycetes bacterium]|nr:hypothetical protein [Planctomycetota bacterium]